MTLPPPPRSPRLPPERFRDSVGWFLLKLVLATTAAAGVAILVVFTAISRSLGDQASPEQVVAILLENAFVQVIAAVLVTTSPVVGFFLLAIVAVFLLSSAVRRFVREARTERS